MGSPMSGYGGGGVYGVVSLYTGEVHNVSCNIYSSLPTAIIVNSLLPVVITGYTATYKTLHKS